jgi:hypothetical protein
MSVSVTLQRSKCGTLLTHTQSVYHFQFFVGFEVLTAVVMKGTTFWNITLCSLLSVNRRFGGMPPALTLVSCSVYFFDPEDGGDVPPKRRLTLNGLHGTISQKMILFIFIFVLFNYTSWLQNTSKHGTCFVDTL